MRLKLLVATAAVMLPAIVSAQSMNAQVFHQKATSLSKKGVMAVFSKDVKTLMREGQASGAAARAQRLAAVKLGSKPRYCPPDGPQKMGSDEFMQRLSAIPQSERARIDMTEAMVRILERKFPCPR